MRTFAACLLLLGISTLKADRVNREPVTVDDVLVRSESPTVAAVWSPDGSSFVYQKHASVYRVKCSGGKPTMWFDLASLDHPSFPPAPAQPYAWRNRRVSEEALQWFPNGKDLLVFDSKSLYIAHQNHSPQRLSLDTPIEDPHLSPDGNSVSYRSAHNLYVLDLSTLHSRQLTHDGSATLLNGELDWVYPEELDVGTAVEWSPDSTAIAFLQFNVEGEPVYPHADLLGQRALYEPQRYPQAGTPNARVRLGVVVAATGVTTWINAGNSPDVLMARMSWLPDSSAIALETAPRIQNTLELLFCDPKTGSTRSVLRETSRDWINIQDNLYFLKGRREFLWTSERSGFRHIYLYAYSGELIRQITAGDWEVRGISAIDDGAGKVLFLSSADSPTETQLYSTTLDGGTPSRITLRDNDHQVGVDPNGQYFVDTFSNLATAPETVLRRIDGHQITTLFKSSSKAGRRVVSSSEIVKIKAADGTLLYGLLRKPADYVEGHKYPVIVKVYGGPQAQSVRNDWHDLTMDDVYTSNGYVVWELDNRGSAGRGHIFEAPVYRKLGSVEIEDQRAGVEYLVRRGVADPKRIGVTGWSYGGYMTIRCLLQAPQVFAVGAAGAPVTDWRNYDTIYTERYMGLPAQDASAYTASSNVAAAGKLEGRLLIQHNLEDDNVLFQNTMQFVNALEEAGKSYSLQLYPQKTHGVSGDLRKSLYSAQLEFFKRNLQ